MRAGVESMGALELAACLFKTRPKALQLLLETEEDVGEAVLAGVTKMLSYEDSLTRKAFQSLGYLPFALLLAYLLSSVWDNFVQLANAASF